ncbi:MAG TPA: sugar phosphate isomerase/epimerase family protein [Terriglobales bacterium]|nr:sugar phosphate isomerase/epimerase family protein [Terriglobales bacterium]
MSTYVYVRERLHPGLLDGLVRGGAEAIEIFAARGHLDYANRKQHVVEIANWFRASAVPLNSVHSPMYVDYDWGRRDSPISITDGEKRKRVDAMDEIKRAIEIAEQIPFRFLIQHLGVGGEDFTDKKLDGAMTCVEHLRAFAKPLGVSILLENIPNDMSTPEKLLEFLNVTHFPDVGVCFDFGHAHLMSSVEEAFGLLRKHIRSTHVHDNKKDVDSHLWPGQGNIDWKQAMELLKTAPHVPPLLMEIEGDDKADISGAMGAAYRRLESS